MLQALAKFKHDDQELVQALCSAASTKVEGFNENHITHTLDALAKLDHFDDGLVKQLYAAARTKAKSFNQKNFDTTFAALRKLKSLGQDPKGSPS
jgi:hypothetical protein